MKYKRYEIKMQKLFEEEARKLFYSLPDKMVNHHLRLTKSKNSLEIIKFYWKQRVDYSWRKFLFNEIDKINSEKYKADHNG